MLWAPVYRELTSQYERMRSVRGLGLVGSFGSVWWNWYGCSSMGEDPGTGRDQTSPRSVQMRSAAGQERPLPCLRPVVNVSLMIF